MSNILTKEPVKNNNSVAISLNRKKNMFWEFQNIFYRIVVIEDKFLSKRGMPNSQYFLSGITTINLALPFRPNDFFHCKDRTNFSDQTG